MLLILLIHLLLFNSHWLFSLVLVILGVFLFLVLLWKLSAHLAAILHDKFLGNLLRVLSEFFFRNELLLLGIALVLHAHWVLNIHPFVSEAYHVSTILILWQDFYLLDSLEFANVILLILH